MTIRNDITIDWFSSPRVLTVAAPSTEVTIQDLHDTCRHFENLHEGMFHDYLIDSAGKEPLGGVVYVGITSTLNNAVLSFEERGGPDWTLCTISGGNLVAVDDVGSELDPRLPTAYVSCDRTASSSATLMEQEALQFSSFDGAVTYDENSGYSGTDFPVGTLQQPVDNFEDALVIMIERGLDTIRIIGDATVGGPGDFTGVQFVGESLSKSEITIETNANVYKAEFYDCALLGVLDGQAVVKDSRIEDLEYIHGVVERCLLDDGVIILGGSQEAVFLDCWCGGASVEPTIDMGGSGQDLSMRNYSGAVKIKNLTGDNNISITLLAGKIILDDTVTAGSLRVGGNGEVFDTLGNPITTGNWNGCDIDTSCLLNPTVITTQVWDEPTADRQTPGTIGGDYYGMLQGFSWMSKIISNKKVLSKSGATWSLIIYDTDDTTPILSKELKDKDGNDIDDITAGVLAQELKTSV